jgi:hypothetical protein
MRHGLLSSAGSHGRLPNLAPNDFVTIADALALIGFGKTQFADTRRGLSHEILGKAGNGYVSLFLNVDLDAEGIGNSTGWLYPSVNMRLLPLTSARKPTPVISSSLL